MTISREAWLAALDIDDVDDQDALTVREIADLLECSIPQAEAYARRLVQTGKALETRKRRRSINGGRAYARAFRLLTTQEPTDAGRRLGGGTGRRDRSGGAGER